MKLEVTKIQSNSFFEIHNVYGPTKSVEKKLLWDVISNTLSNSRVIIEGDFNAITDF